MLPVTALAELLSGDYSAEPKRALAAACFQFLKSALGDAGLHELCTAAALQASSFLTADDTMDAGLPGVAEWLKEEGLADAVPA